MSIEGKVVDAAPGQPDDPQALQEEIARTREHLGQTVEALVAKVDVKARAQDEAGRLIGRLKAKAVEARQQAASRAAQARRQAADKTAGPLQQATAQGRHVRRRVADSTAGPRQQATSLGGSVAEQAASLGGSVAEQVKPQAAAVAAGISKVTPEPVKQAAGNAAATARQRRTPLLAAIGAVGAGLVGWLLFQRWRRRG